MSSVLEGFLSTSEVLEAFGDRNFVAAMLRFESALVSAQAAAGLVPESAARSIVGTCKVDLFDCSKIVRESSRSGSLAIPLVRSLKETVGLFNQDAVPFVHLGSTSQDVIDTTMALITRDVLNDIEVLLKKSIEALLTLAQKHMATPMLARTLMQPASVTSFGLKCAHWAAPLVRSLHRLRVARLGALKVQLGGGVGTLARMGDKGPQIVAHMARELGLEIPQSSWHTQRDEWLALGCDLALMVGSLGKIAKDISLLGQLEVGEVSEGREPGRGASSDMPYKNNPVASMAALAAAARVPQRLATMLAAMPQEHERALGGWQAELAEWAQLLMSAHASSKAMASALPDLVIDTGRMSAHIADAARSVTKEEARTWFDPQLANGAGEIARSCLQALRADLATPAVRLAA
ncbi:MAG: 3-carboxy-cis,cis-muconate cycloisomerase [Burkholderiales bacterium]|nr:3-carboxy-cis,cis-muconate cycloisomerase [Burkholderiales bacterium]